MARGKISVARGIHCCTRPPFLYCEQCVYIDISDTVQTVYELPLLPNNIAVKRFTQIVAVRSVDWIFVVVVLVWL